MCGRFPGSYWPAGPEPPQGTQHWDTRDASHMAGALDKAGRYESPNGTWRQHEQSNQCIQGKTAKVWWIQVLDHVSLPVLGMIGTTTFQEKATNLLAGLQGYATGIQRLSRHSRAAMETTNWLRPTVIGWGRSAIMVHWGREQCHHPIWRLAARQYWLGVGVNGCMAGRSPGGSAGMANLFRLVCQLKSGLLFSSVPPVIFL
jgi:hypothetical protein